MKVEIKNGYIHLKNKDDPVYIVLHTGPNYSLPTIRDTNSDTVASLCWKKTGGRLLLSTMARNPLIGVDLNREVPDKKTAIKEWKNAVNENVVDFKKVYGMVAKNEKDYEKRIMLYKNFWKIAKSTGKHFILLHTQDLRIGNYPSLFDIVTFDGIGIKKERTMEIIKKLNKKFRREFSNLENNFKTRLLASANSIETDKMLNNTDAYAEWFERDTGVIRKYGDKNIVKRLENSITKENFIRAVENVLKKDIPLKITLEQNFWGAKAFAPKKELIGKNRKVVEIEVNGFLNNSYPELVADVLVEFVKML
ncbi:MAG: hypothetical protein ISS36_02025 [Candidatus Aenigmarchaeota archaeon]|nr:hypothetical protein [Candidatus Aenigmarchaeota archaeon]